MSHRPAKEPKRERIPAVVSVRAVIHHADDEDKEQKGRNGDGDDARKGEHPVLQPRKEAAEVPAAEKEREIRPGIREKI